MKRYKVGIVGLNFGRLIIDKIVDGAASKYFKVCAVCDLDQEKAMAEARRIGAVVYPDLKALLKSPDVQVVGLFTGPVGRADLIRKIVRAGKDVVTTKPFEQDVLAAREVLREAARLRRLVMLNSPAPQLSDDMALIAQWREKYQLGEPIGARAEVWANYREKRDGSWYDDPKKCPLAPIYRLGIYLINDLVQVFGRAKRVSSLSTRIFTGRPTADNAQIGIEFENGALANIFASFCVRDQQHYRNSLTLNFERGTIYRNIGPEPYRSGLEYRALMSLIACSETGKTRVCRREVGWNGHEYPWKAFYSILNDRDSYRARVNDEILEGLSIIKAAARSEQNRKSEQVD
jgi:predicted dehydrogenase